MSTVSDRAQDVDGPFAVRDRLGRKQLHRLTAEDYLQAVGRDAACPNGAAAMSEEEATPPNDLNTQVAPFPHELKELVDGMVYRPGWRFDLEHVDRGQGSEGLTFKILSKGYDTYNPDEGETYRVWHYMPVPPAAFDRRAWKRWLLDQLLLAESHEACEFLQLDGERPFAPNHGPGRNPYSILELTTEVDVRTQFTGSVDEP